MENEEYHLEVKVKENEFNIDRVKTKIQEETNRNM